MNSAHSGKSPVPALLISLLAPFLALGTFLVALVAIAGGADELARLWVAADTGAYGVCAAAGVGMLLVGVGLYLSGTRSPLNCVLIYGGALLPVPIGLLLMRHGIQRVVDAITSVNPADKGTIYAAGVSEALGVPLIASLAVFAVAGTAALALLALRLIQGPTSGRLPYRVAAAGAVAIAALGLLGGMQLAGCTKVFGAVAFVAPNDKLTVLAAGLEELATNKRIATVTASALALTLLVLSGLALVRGRLRGPGVIGVGMALASLAFAYAGPSIALAMSSSQTPDLEEAGFFHPDLQLATAAETPVESYPIVELGLGSLAIGRQGFDWTKPEQRAQAVARLRELSQQYVDLHAMAGDSTPLATGVAVDTRLAGNALRALFEILGEAGLTRAVLCVQTPVPKLSLPESFERLAPMLRPTDLGGFPIELHATPDSPYPAVALGSVTPSSLAQVASIPEHMKSKRSSVAVLIGDDATGEQLMRLVAEASEHGLALHVPVTRISEEIAADQGP